MDVGETFRWVVPEQALQSYQLVNAAGIRVVYMEERTLIMITSWRSVYHALGTSTLFVLVGELGR